ncbi:hypothetical protein L873DRAFT_1930559, partial [Choiromyces venosus 120613-1]
FPSRSVTGGLPSPSPCPVGSPPCGSLPPEQPVDSPIITTSPPFSPDPEVDQFPSLAHSRAQSSPQSQWLPGLGHTLPPTSRPFQRVAPMAKSKLVSCDETGPVTAPGRSGMSCGGPAGFVATTPASQRLLLRPLPSAAPTAIARLPSVPTSHDPLSADPSGLSGLSTGFLLHPPAPTLTQPTAGSAGLRPNTPALNTQLQPAPSKRRHIGSTSSPS